MTKDQKPADEAAQEGNDLGGSPTFPNPPSAQPTGDPAGFNGSFGETEHHTQHEYDAGNQGPKEDGDKDEEN
ncbi:hypothetical protein GCM10027403_09340 [Arthrobacter tecti]